MAGEAPGGFGGDGGFGGGGFATDGGGLAAGFYSGGGFEGFGGFGGGMGLGDASAALPPMSVGEGLGGPLAGSDAGLEKAFSMGPASSMADANLVIHADGSKEWTNPVGPDNVVKVWAEEAALNNPDNVIAQLNAAKTELANGTAVTKDGVNITGGKKGTFDVPASAEQLPEYLKSKNAGEEDDDESDSPTDQGGGGGGGGGGDCTPPSEDPEEDKTNPEGSEEEAAAADKQVSKTVADEGAHQLKENGGMSMANFSSYSHGLWEGSQLASLFSKYDKDGDGKLDPEEMDAMQADPGYKAATDEMNQKIGNDPALADLKKSLGTAEGLSNFNKLQGLGDSAQKADVDKVFSSGAQGAVSKLAFSQEMQAAGLKPNDNLPTDAAAQKALFESEKIKSILSKLVNGKHVFSF